ncbi:hypothetical protein D7Y04_28955 [Corallococcus sp. AB038B]|nr:hypothetical protein D7Y04_28955 [Corallococcus sp. AB038B]
MLADFFALGAVLRRAACASSMRPSKGTPTTVASTWRSGIALRRDSITSCTDARGASECTGRETRVRAGSLTGGLPCA